MNAEQFKRANRSSFYVTIVIIISGVLLTLFNIVTQGMTGGSIAILIGALIGGALVALGNFKYSTIKKVL